MGARLEQLFADYAGYHRSEGNQLCHTVGIPLIVAGLLGLLAIEVFRVGGWPVEVSLLLLAALAPVYLRLDARLGGAFLLLCAVLYLGTRLLGWPWNLGLFVVGWGFQFIGHAAYEHRAPAFTTNLTHLLVGPLWVLNHYLHVRTTS